MGIFRRNKDKPRWLEQTRKFCHARNIVIVAWGPRALVVEAQSPGRRDEIAGKLANWGFQVVADENDEGAGLLTLSHED